MEGRIGSTLGVSSFSKQGSSVTELIATGQYSQIATSLQQIQSQSQPVLAALQAAALQLCHSCEQADQMIAGQQQALAQMVTQQQAQQQQLVDLLQMVGSLTTAVSTTSLSAPHLQTTPPTSRFAQPIPSSNQNVPTLVIYLLGEFRLYQDDQPVVDWPSGKGKTILKYLLLHRQRPVAREVLMDTFWPDSTADAARNNLNVAIYGLRKALRDGYGEFSHIVFQDNAYFLNPEMNIWVDVEAFALQLEEANRWQQVGDWQTAVSAYQAAAAIFQGELLAEDRYEEWIFADRQQLNTQYTMLLEQLSHHHFNQQDFHQCMAASHRLLAVDACHEQAHRWLMLCYAHQGQRNLALRQYHACCTALEQELEVEPDLETTKLYEQIRCGQTDSMATWPIN